MNCIYKNKQKCKITRHNCTLGNKCPVSRDPETCGYSSTIEKIPICELLSMPCISIPECPGRKVK